MAATAEKELTLVSELKVPSKKSGSKSKIDPDVVYEFELCDTYEAGRPVERKSDDAGRKIALGAPYPPSFTYPNSGIARDPETNKARNWRYIEGQPSIWIDDQVSLAEYDRNEIDKLLGQPENILEFKNGKMLVPGTQQLRIEALKALDYFEGNKTPYRVRHADKFRLNNPDVSVEASLSIREMRFKAMEQARGCSVIEMLAVSAMLGIDVSDTSDKGLFRIKDQFLQRAEYDPANPKGLTNFMEIINNPTTRINYIFDQGFKQDILSANQQPGILTWAAMNTPIMTFTTRKTPVDELVGLVVAGDELAVKVMKQVEAKIK